MTAIWEGSSMTFEEIEDESMVVSEEAEVSEVEVAQEVDEGDSYEGENILSTEETESHTRESLRTEFSNLCETDEDLNSFAAMHARKRVLAEIELICQLFSNNCHVKGCSGECSVGSTKSVGGVLEICWKCSNGHYGIWHSSSLLGRKRGQKVFVLPVLAAAAVLISGNNFEKIQMLMNFANIDFISEATFNRVQSFHAIPAIQELWQQMKLKIWEVMKGQPLVLSGDGRNDSPGHSAKNLVYTIMEHVLNVIMDVEIVDVRETGGVSTTMERLGLRRLIERMMRDLHVSEAVTDASAMIIKLLRDLKGTFWFVIVVGADNSSRSCSSRKMNTT